MNTVVNPKCSGCKSFWSPDESDIKGSGLVCKTCRRCRDYSKKNKEQNTCIHNKIKSRCKECGGSEICQHNRQKSSCRECGGVSICPHNRIKSRCKECGGNEICQHNRQKSSCRECGGSQICPHNKRKSRCQECGGSSICQHNRRKSQCKECDLQLYLIHLQRNQIKRCINLSNLTKTKPSIEYLGCSAEYFIEYLKKKMDKFNQFSEIEMNWNNIHIDHIKPVSSFNLDNEEDFLSCSNYTNMQPLLVEINLNKSCKWSDEDDVFWNENIKDKEYIDIYIPM